MEEGEESDADGDEEDEEGEGEGEEEDEESDADGDEEGEKTRRMATIDSQQTLNSPRNKQHRQNRYTSIHAIHAESVGYTCTIHTHYSLTFTLAVCVPHKHNTAQHSRS